LWQYDPSLNVWIQKTGYGGGARIEATGFSIGNKGYIGVGDDSTFFYSIDFWEYSPDSTSGIEEINKLTDISLYPNPTSGNFTLSYHLKNNLQASFKLIDITGRIVNSEKLIVNSEYQTIDVSYLDNGVYYWQVISDKCIEGNGKLVEMK
jgi:hypothetical protein